jgi:dihydrodipicolinate synthase/N-acetylneuraminate lyase
MSLEHKKMNWQGIYAIIVTPFHEDLSIDWETLEREIEFCIDCGVHGLVGPAIASEFFTLSDAERLEFVQKVARWTNRRVPFVAGVSGVSGHHAAALARGAEGAGAEALMAMPPYVVPGSAESTFAYYERIASASSLPLVVQNAPAPFSSPLSTAQLVSLLERLPSIQVIKEETFPNPQKVGQICRAAGARLQGVFGGLGGIYLFNELERGGTGTMPACQFADVMVDIFNLYKGGNHEAARDRFMTVQPALVLERLYNMTFIKVCLQRRGVFKNALTRVPEPALDANDLRELDEIWRRLDPFFR